MVFGYFSYYSILSIGLVAVGCGRMLSGFQGVRRSAPPVLGMAALSVLYTVGYSVVWVESRFFLIAAVLLSCYGMLAVQQLEVSGHLKRCCALLLAIVLVLSLWRPALKDLGDEAGKGMDDYALSRAFPSFAGQNIASNDYYDALSVSFFSRAVFYGLLPLKAEATANAKALKENKIRYFLLLGEDKIPEYLGDFDRVDGGDIGHWQVFIARSIK